MKKPETSEPTPLSRILARRAKARGQKRRGVALIMVLGTLVILTVLVTQLHESSISTLSAALADRDSMKAEYHARSAVNLSRRWFGARSIRCSRWR